MQLHKQKKSVPIDLQDRICSALESEDRKATLKIAEAEEGGGGRSRVMEGQVFESRHQFSSVLGNNPSTATAKRPQLAGVNFRAMGTACRIRAILTCRPRNEHTILLR